MCFFFKFSTVLKKSPDISQKKRINLAIDELEDNVEAFIRETPAEILERVCQNWTKRMDHLRRCRGQPLHEIICKH